MELGGCGLVFRLGSRVFGFGCRAWISALGFGVWFSGFGTGFRVWSSGCGIQVLRLALGIRALVFGLWYPGFGIRALRFGLRDSGIRALGFGQWDLGFGIRALGFGLWDSGSGIRALSLGLWDWLWCYRRITRVRGVYCAPDFGSRRYRGTSLIINHLPLGPYRSLMPRVLGGFKGGGRFLMSEVPL